MRVLMRMMKLVLGFGLLCFFLVGVFVVLKLYYDYFGWGANDWIVNYVGVIEREASRNIGNNVVVLFCLVKSVGLLVGIVIVNLPVLMLFSIGESNPVKLVRIRK
jgi:hypothetical protein